MNTIPPDEHLRQALRHAPDADVTAPQALSAQILAAARRSAAQAPPTATLAPRPWHNWVAAWWRRPAASAAFASVLMVGLVGLLWREGVPGPASDGSPAPLSSEAASRVAPRPAPRQATPDSPLQKPAMDAELEQRATKVQAAAGATAERPDAAATPQHRADASRRAKGLSDQAPAVQRKAQPAAITPVEPDHLAQAESTARSEALSLPAQLPVQPLAQPSVQPPTPAPVPLIAASAAAAPVRATGSAVAPPMAIAAAQAGRAQRAAAREAAAPLNAAVADARPGLPWPGGPAEGDEWRWLSGSALRAPDGAWWSSLTRATQGRWQLSADALPAAGAAQLEWQRAGSSIGSLWIEPTAVLWCGTAPPCHRAPLPAERRRELLEQLAR